MIPAILQWLFYLSVGGLLWLLGNQAVHVRQFGWFAGLMVIIAAVLVAVIVGLERRKKGEASDGSE